MRTVILSAAAACAIATPAWAQPPAAGAAPEQTAPSVVSVKKASPEDIARMQALRKALTARTAVYDRTEQAFRNPTDAERAELLASVPAPAAAAGIEMARGGVAMRGAAGELSYLIADKQPDGSTAVRHGDAASLQRPAFARPITPPLTVQSQPRAQGVRHAQ